MRRTSRSNGRVRFAEFEVDLTAGEIWKNGSRVRLDGHPFRVLTVLVARPGEVVTRENLKRSLWPSDTFVDFDHGINEAVKRLREALGDSAETPRFIETLRRRGYRFIHPLEPVLPRKKTSIAAALVIGAVALAGLVISHSGATREGSSAPSFADIQSPGIPPGSARLPGAPTTMSLSADPLTYDDYLKGVFYSDMATGEGIRKSIEHFRSAIERDPTFAPAWAGLADGYNRAAIRHEQHAAEAYPIAKAAAARALALDQHLPDAHVMAGVVAFRFDVDWSAAERNLKRALELDPHHSRARLAYGTYLAATGRIDAAIDEARLARQIDPVTPQRYMDLAWKLQMKGPNEEAIHQLRTMLTLVPDFALGQAILADAYARVGRRSEALAHCRRAVEAGRTKDATIQAHCGRVYALLGLDREARQILDSMLLAENPCAYDVALLLDGLGRTDDALDWLERAFTEPEPEIALLRTAPWSDAMRTDPRYRELVRRLKFPPVAVATDSPGEMISQAAEKVGEESWGPENQLFAFLQKLMFQI